MAKPDCTTCGLCCISLDDNEVYCNLEEEDIDRIPKRYKKYIQPVSVFRQLVAQVNSGLVEDYPVTALATKEIIPRSGPCKGVTLCVCALLQGTPLKKISCAIYKQRPKACHKAVVPGDKTCRWIRKQVQEALQEG